MRVSLGKDDVDMRSSLGKMQPRKVKQVLRGSRALVGLAGAARGMVTDVVAFGAIIGRQKKIDQYLRSHSVRSLHIGASNNVLEGWLNTDISLGHDSVVYLNATARFPFGPNTFDYIMAEHMIEHVEFSAAQSMLSECFRVLKPGGRARFSTPDLGVLLSLHAGEKSTAQQRYIDWMTERLMPCVQRCREVFVINNAFRAWGHCFLYDQKTLQFALENVGFRDIRFFKPGISDDANLKGLESHGKEIQAEDINQFETIVVEGSKAK